MGSNSSRKKGARVNWDEPKYKKALPELIVLRNNKVAFRTIAKTLNEKYGLNIDEHIAKRAYVKETTVSLYDISKESLQEDVKDNSNDDLEDINYKETIEISQDGSHKSDKLLRMSSEESKDVNYLLEAHGYDIEEWILVSARNNIWNTYSKKDGVQTLYSSKITVKSKVGNFSIEKLIEAIREEPAITIKTNKIVLDDKKMLEIPIYDSHFGISTYEYYQPTQARILEKIASTHWEETLFIIGQDMLHNDNFRGKTSSGTEIEVVDMIQAWKDCKAFYYPLIESAIKHSNNVKIYYSKGNHDESMSWSFVQLLMERYPQLEVNDSFMERKAYTFGENFIGITHGDKARKNIHNIFQTEFPLEWANAKNREIHMGHLHIEDAKDIFGMMVRTLATRNKTDKWHKDNGFVGGHKRFMLFEYSEEELLSIHYV